MGVTNDDKKNLDECTSFEAKDSTIIEGFNFPASFADFAPKIRDLKVFDSDILVTSYPKCGTTWTQEMVWLIANDLNYEKAKKSLDERFPFLEFTGLFDFDSLMSEKNVELPEYWFDSIKMVQEQKTPRFVKTHLPWNLLPKEIQNGTKKPKIIHTLRDPKDICVSSYHHMIIMVGQKYTFEEYCDLFLNDKLTYSPFWKNVSSYWQHRNQENVLFLRYEDMKKDLPSVICKVAKFLGKTMTDDEVAVLSDHLSFENMKKNEFVNKDDRLELFKKLKLGGEEGKFLRSGKVGGYKEMMTNEIVAKCEKWIDSNMSESKIYF